MTKINKLDALGSKTNIPNRPDKSILEKINNPKTGLDYSIRLTCPEHIYMSSYFSARLCIYNFRLCQTNS